MEIYGSSSAPTLPPISVENGMLSFYSQADVMTTLDYLEYKYDEYDDAFMAQYPGLTDDQIADVEESVGYNDEQPFIEFENQFGIWSKRAQLTAAEDYWLATTSEDYPNQNENPDYAFIEDDEFRTIITAYGELKVGSTYYMFNDDGSYYEAPAHYFNEFASLRGSKSDQSLPPHVVKREGSTTLAIIVPPPPECKAPKRNRDRKLNGNWRFDHVTSIINYPWGGRILAKTKSYKKVGGHWKKRRATIGALVKGDVVNANCNGGAYMESSCIEKKRKKVKAKVTAGMFIKTYSGNIQSFHYSGQVGNFWATLTWNQ